MTTGVRLDMVALDLAFLNHSKYKLNVHQQIKDEQALQSP